MLSDLAIQAHDISKCYQVYGNPSHRLKQVVYPRVARVIGREPRKYFDEFWALNGVSFDIRKGETVGIVGRNGSGKSTLLQVICGTLNPTSGTLTANGRIAALLELGSGFNPEFTGRENVYMNAALLGLTKSETDARYDDIVAFADIGDFVDQPVKTYSSGMTVRLAFAVAINVDPEILVVDEALSVGDELFQRKCFSRIAAIKQLGATILFVSHSAGTIVELCDRAVLMDGGEMLTIGEPKKIVAQYQRLLYAPAEERVRIRQDIRDGVAVQRGPDPVAKQGGAQGVVSASIDSDGGGSGSAAAEEVDDDETYGSFDPNLVPTSTIAYQSQGAEIVTPEIFTPWGRRVNHLVRGRTYFYRYKVKFSAPATSVRFGMLIKTITGVELGGGVSTGNYREYIDYVEPHTELVVEFRFRCSLNPGVYFMNAGVLGNLDGSETYMHRLIDVAMFRVLPVPNSRATGFMDFDCVPTVSAVEQAGSAQ